MGTFHGDELRGQMASVGMHQRGYLERAANKIDELTHANVTLQGEVNRYQRRERFIKDALGGVTDDGQYVNDIISRIQASEGGSTLVARIGMFLHDQGYPVSVNEVRHIVAICAHALNPSE